MLLLDLPVEIRLIIYSYALSLDTAIHSVCRLHEHPTQKLLNLSLLLVCKQTNSEAFSIFYKENEFLWHILNGPVNKESGNICYPNLETGPLAGLTGVETCPLNYITSAGVVINSGGNLCFMTQVWSTILLLKHLRESAPRMRELKILTHDRIVSWRNHQIFFIELEPVMKGWTALKRIKLNDGYLEFIVVDEIREMRPDITILKLLGPELVFFPVIRLALQYVLTLLQDQLLGTFEKLL
jgi:hypothetical protein